MSKLRPKYFWQQPGFTRLITLSVFFSVFALFRFGSHPSSAQSTLPTLQEAEASEPVVVEEPTLKEEVKPVTPKPKIVKQQAKKKTSPKKKKRIKAQIQIPSPELENLITEGLSESDPAFYSRNALISSVQPEGEFWVEASIPLVPRVTQFENLVQQDGFYEKMDQATQEVALSLSGLTEVTPVVVADNTGAEPQDSASAEKAIPEFSVEAVVTEPPGKNELVAVVSPTIIPNSAPTLEAPKAVAPESIKENTAAVVAQSKEPPKEANRLAMQIETPSQGTLVDGQTRNQIVDPSVSVPVPFPTKRLNSDPLHSDQETIYGQLEPDTRFSRWMDSQNAFVELELKPLDSRVVADTIYLTDYKYPDRRFEIERAKLSGSYTLTAVIHQQGKIEPVAEIPYSQPIAANQYQELIHFKINWSDFRQSKSRGRAASTGKVVLNLTIFEGASGSYREPRPIPDAELEILGFSIKTEIRSDAQGNIRIPKVTPSSQYLCRVSAKGYYPTEVVVPVFHSDVYLPVFLIAKEKVHVVTEYFTRHPQRKKKALVFGRLYNAHTKRPRAGKKISLSQRSGPPLYFGALPDLKLEETTSVGLFSFFNVTPAFRFLKREHSSPLLVPFKPDHAYYFEFGRGGEKEIHGQLVDPHGNPLPITEIEILGENENSVLTDANARFSIPAVDLPTGLVTLEMRAEGYPVTWHSMGWNVQEPQSKEIFRLIREEYLLDSMDRSKIKLENNVGVLVGGADRNLLDRRDDCLQVKLFDNDLKAVSGANGPFPLQYGEILRTNDALCLTEQNPGFGYYNLKPGRYLIKWVGISGKVYRTEVTYIGLNRLSIL